MIYYRVAWKTNQSSTWQWKSTLLTSLDTLIRFLRIYNAIPKDRLRVFSSTSREDMEEMLIQENNGLASNSLTAAQFLHERRIHSPETAEKESEPYTRRSTGTLSTAALVKQPLNESISSGQLERQRQALDTKRLEVELGTGGDHDTPYTFTLPTSVPQVLAWTKLLVKIQAGELQS